MDSLEKSAYEFMNETRNAKERLEGLLQHDIVQAIADGFNGHDVRRDVILKDVNWLIEQAEKLQKIREEADEIYNRAQTDINGEVDMESEDALDFMYQLITRN